MKPALDVPGVVLTCVPTIVCFHLFAFTKHKLLPSTQIKPFVSVPNCVVLGTFEKSIYVSNELFYAGVDPNEMRFKRTGCFDVGVKCGGWGKIVMEIKVEDRKK